MIVVTEDVLQLSAALLIGTLVGAEREYHSKSAGLRTMILVSIGSCLFTILSIRIGGEGNPDRIAANIITGIGFLGAGVIFKDDNRVSGITTATTIWMVAALGMAIGSGHVFAALIGSVIVMLVLIAFVFLQKQIDDFNQQRSYRIICPYQNETLSRYESLFREYHLRSIRGKHTKRGNEIIGIWLVQGPRKNHERLVARLLQDDDIKEFDF